MLRKIKYYDEILDSSGLYTITQIATDYGLSARKLNAILEEHGIQKKENKKWRIVPKYITKGYVRYVLVKAHNGKAIT